MKNQTVKFRLYFFLERERERETQIERDTQSGRREERNVEKERLSYVKLESLKLTACSNTVSFVT